MLRNICFSAGFFLAAIAQAESPKTLKACTVSWPPFVVMEGNVVGGSDTTILRNLVKKMGFADVEVEEVPWKRCLKLAEEGQVDIVYPASKKPDREVYLHYPKIPLHPVSYVFVTTKDAPQSWTSDKKVSSLPQPIGIPLGYSIAEKLRLEPDAKFDENSKDDLVNIQKLLLGRVGTIIIEKMNAKALIESLKASDKLVILDQPYHKDKEYYVTISKKSPVFDELVKKMDAELPALVPKHTD